jgi:hypothetical protein
VDGRIPLWHVVFSRFRLHWVMPCRVEDLYAVDRRALSECGCAEDDSFMSYVVFMERKKCKML